MNKINELALKAMVKMDSFKSKMREENGASAVEYGLLVGLIAVVIVVAITTLGTGIETKFQEASDKLNP